MNKIFAVIIILLLAGQMRELPLKLPPVENFEPGSDGESPLAKIESFVNCKCPKCGGDVLNGKYGFYCNKKCGMNIGRVYSKALTEAQVTKLLSGKSISYTLGGKKTVVLPEIDEHSYQGKTYIQWKTKRE